MAPQIRVAGILLSDGAILLESLADREVWGLPGGGLERGETLEEGCRREFREELGREVRCEGMENHFPADGQPHFELRLVPRRAPMVSTGKSDPPGHLGGQDLGSPSACGKSERLRLGVPTSADYGTPSPEA
jgi:8-oxo-dGTP pyrophosphatase MutT (NUDIX family)